MVVGKRGSVGIGTFDALVVAEVGVEVVGARSGVFVGFEQPEVVEPGLAGAEVVADLRESLERNRARVLLHHDSLFRWPTSASQCLQQAGIAPSAVNYSESGNRKFPRQKGVGIFAQLLEKL